MTTFMFPGQGSQVKGMGAELFAKYPQYVSSAYSVLGYSIQDLCLNDSKQELGNTEFTQPALYVVEALSYIDKIANSPKPKFCIGHSLGEYSALFAAGVVDFETGLKLTQKRGSLMSKATGGGMLAVINLPVDRIQSLLQSNNLGSIDIANYNSSKQIVLSGPSQDIIKANEVLSKEAMMCVPLKVSGAFHSRYMQPAADEFKQFIDTIQFQPIQIPVIANVTAQPYTNENIKDNLVKQITHSVRWMDIIKYLKTNGETEFVEVGPGNVLARLMAQN